MKTQCKKSTRSDLCCAQLSLQVAEREERAKTIVQQNAPELYDALVALMPHTPPQGQTFAGANEWKPWCRLVEELEMISHDTNMDIELQMLQGMRLTIAGAYEGARGSGKTRSEAFFIFLPLLSYIVALLRPRARIQMLLLDHIAPFVQYTTLPRGHPARLSLTRADLYVLLLYTQSEEATKALFTLSTVSRFSDINEKERKKIIIASLLSTYTSFENKREIVRLLYEEGLDEHPTYIDTVKRNLIVYLLDVAQRRPHAKPPLQLVSAIPSSLFQPYDKHIAYQSALVALVADEIIVAPTEVPYETFLSSLFPADSLTTETYTNILEPFLYRTTLVLVKHHCKTLFSFINTLVSVSPSLIEAYLRERLLPAFFDNENGLYHSAVEHLTASALNLLAIQLTPERQTALLAVALAQRPRRPDMLLLISNLVSLGADLAAVDIRARTGHPQDMLRYFLHRRPVVSVNALRSACYVLKTKDFIQYVSAPTLTLAEKIRIATSAYKTGRVKVLRRIEEDIGPLAALWRAPVPLILEFITPTRFVKLVEYLGENLRQIWVGNAAERKQLREKLKYYEENDIRTSVQKTARRALRWYPWT